MEDVLTKEQYQNSLKWMQDKAQQLEHPLLDESSKEKLMKKYNYVSSKVDEYLNHYFAERDTELNEIYQEQGLILADEPEEDEDMTDWMND
ncbi:hypothetical protein D7Z54_14465 [Salibacterium salarium]|uniref:Uncharacterized protein n=1 Tax=Salibacterium salarium TaxID=284579 RepID=A0A3R9QKB6_9BACI|nr:hypothetical protein [Salibacterium salarium]RSL32651.1 hypothetical protein D7Z54_14465 [Salibacterium salarium]